MNTITIEINGEKRKISPVKNVSELLQVLEMAATGLAVEINRKIIRRNEWDCTPVADGDRVEIVRFVGGG